MRVFTTPFAAIVLVLALGLSLSACSSCQGSSSQSQPQGQPQARIIDPASPLAAQPKPTAEIPAAPKEIDWKTKVAEAEAAFKKAHAEAPNRADTWHQYLKICEAKVKQGSPDAVSCYATFLQKAREIKFEDEILAAALRWRIILSLEQERSKEAWTYWEQLLPVQQRLLAAGKLNAELKAYSAYIEGGVMQLQNDMPAAVNAFERALAFFKDSGKKPDPQYLSYLEKLGIAYCDSGKSAQCLQTFNKAEQTAVSLFGAVHPEVAVMKLYKIRALLANGDLAQARSEWTYIHRIFGGSKPTDLPPDVDKLYVETMILLDTARDKLP